MMVIRLFFAFDDPLGRRAKYTDIGRHFGITWTQARQVVQSGLEKKIRQKHNIPEPK